MLTKLSPYATLSLTNCHVFSFAYTIVASILSFFPHIAKVQTQRMKAFLNRNNNECSLD